MSYTPKTDIIDGVEVKTLTNWKIVQVHRSTVAAVSYDGANNRQWVTTEIISGNGEFVKTRSGTTYRLPRDQMHNSMWVMGLQIKRPDQHENLRKAGVI